MKVAILCIGNKGGVWTFVYNISIYLKKYVDVEVFVIILPNSKKIKIPSVKTNYIVIDIHSIKNTIISIKKLLSSLKQFNIIHINQASLFLLLIFVRKKAKIFYTVHASPLFKWETSYLKIFYLFERIFISITAKQVDYVVTVSNFLKKELEQKYNIHSKVIYNGVDTKKFHPFNKQIQKKKLGMNYKPLILFVERIYKLKDPYTMLKAIDLISKRISKAHFLLITYGDIERKFYVTIKKLGLKNKITIMHNVPYNKINQYYAAADVYILTSFYESFSFTTLEAMATGTPVIIPRIGALRELWSNVALFFEPGDPVELSNSVTKILSDKCLYNQKVRKCIERSRNFSWKKISKLYFKLYSSVD
jgi:glycosyltransferase involved in cell wall biosynthesis